MKRMNRILIGVGCVALLLISWLVTISAPSDKERQLKLMDDAEALMTDEIYIRAVPLLEDAIGYSTEHTFDAESALKRAYLQLLDQTGFRRKYLDLLAKQMGRENASPELFKEAAQFYLGISKRAEAFSVFRDGIAKTGSQELIDLYESCRYEYRLGYTIYEDVSEIFGTTIGVSRDGLWGLATSEGELIIPMEYDKISTFSSDRAFVKKDGRVFAVDKKNNRLVVFQETVTDFGNFAFDRLPALIDGNWYRLTGELEKGSAIFDWIGIHAEGRAAAQSGGKWGVISRTTDWVIPAEYDGIIMDALGRCYGQGAVFVQRGTGVQLLVGGELLGTYEDARPFSSEGYAAVKKDGKWGFIDPEGTVQIPYQFDEALSFGQHLAAVRVDERWGYVNLYGNIVIDPSFLQAKSFADGSAPVLTEKGWRFITLLEYKKGAGL